MLCQPSCCGRTEARSEDPEKEREHRHDQHEDAEAHDRSECTSLEVINQGCHDQGEEALKNDFSRDEKTVSGVMGDDTREGSSTRCE